MMRIRGRRVNSARIAVPGSKSVANRVLICAALAEGTTTVGGLPDGDDTSLMLECLAILGCTVERKGDAVSISRGVPTGEQVVHCGLAGTTSRFLTAFASTLSTTTVVDGGAPLRARPMVDLHDALRTLGVQFEYLGEEGKLPVRVIPRRNDVHQVSIRGDVSSQFISALMLVAPRLGGLTISLSTELVSRPYVDMTAHVLRQFGAEVSVSADRLVVTSAPLVATTVVVEPDFSSAAFLVGIAAIVGCEISIPNLALSRLQGDSRILEIAKQMGVFVRQVGDNLIVSRDAADKLSGVRLNMADCSDLVPIVTVMALFADGDTTIDGIGFIRQKESNRIDDLATELRKTGAQVEVQPDGLEIRGGHPLIGAHLLVHDDHRMAMAFAVLATMVEGVSIDDPSVVSKSWPSFWEDTAPVLEALPS